jgi:hypothetical protein
MKTPPKATAGTPAERLQARFTALDETSREAFFAMNRDAILAWVARQGGKG